MYKVDKAIIMAAGKGSRLRPITDTIPKPLVRVNGIRMIDTVIHALHQHGIHEIYIVVGYLKECFEELKNDYPEIQLIDNPYYDTCNNISSLYVAREHLQNVVILDGDQMIYQPQILNPYFERSGYCCIYKKDIQDEWVLTLKDDIVIDCQTQGAKEGWQLYSVSFWNEQDGKTLKKHLEEEFILKKNTQVYWDHIALKLYPKDFQLGIREISSGDLIEIDRYEELVQLDESYQRRL